MEEKKYTLNYFNLGKDEDGEYEFEPNTSDLYEFAAECLCGCYMPIEMLHDERILQGLQNIILEYNLLEKIIKKFEQDFLEHFEKEADMEYRETQR